MTWVLSLALLAFAGAWLSNQVPVVAYSWGDAVEEGEPSTPQEIKAEGSLVEQLPPVAIAVVVTLPFVGSGDWHTGLAVYAHSLRKATAALSRTRRVDHLAIVPTALPEADTHALEELGLSVRKLPVPVHLHEVQSAYARRSMEKEGCCGDLEQLKYHGAALTEYDRILVVDADEVFFRPVDELFDLSPSFALVGTYNHNLDIGRSVFPVVQGGFLLFRPNMDDYDALKALTREGDFRAGSAWKGSNTGWAYGGSGPQGLLSFYYNQVRPGAPGFDPTPPVKGFDVPGNFTKQPNGSRFLPLDHTVYNVVHPYKQRLSKGFAPWRWPVAQEWFQPERVKAFHFTGQCQKPWRCHPVVGKLCTAMTEQWWALYQELNNSELAGKLTCKARARGTR